MKIISVKCPQCGYLEAMKSFHSPDRSIEVQCFRCGLEEREIPVLDANGQKMGWKAEAEYGAGAIRYGAATGGSHIAYCLHKTQEIAEYEVWLREHIVSGELDETACHLTRWNEETKQVEMVMGAFYE